MSRTFLRRTVWCACVALAAVALAACGSSSKKSSSSATSSAAATSSASSASSGSSGSSGAAAAVTAAEKSPTSIEISTPLKSKPKTGKVIDFLRCSQPVCAGFAQGLAPAAKALGWTLKSIGFQPTPQAEVQAIDSAVQTHPAGIFMTGLDRAVIESGLKQAQAAKIPVVDGYTTNAAVAPIIANVANGPAGNSAGPISAANFVAANSGCKGTVAVYSINTYPILNFGVAKMVPELKKLCPSIQIKQFNAQATDVGTKIPGEVTSAVQQDPSIKYVMFSFGDMALGVPAALKAAGLSAKIVGFGAGEPGNVENVAKGIETAESGYGIPYGGFRAMDAFARYFEGMSVKIDTTAPNPGQLFTSTNAKGVTSWGNLAVAPDMPQQFEKLWHVG